MLFRSPYTQALLYAVPRIDGKGIERIRLEGDLPSPAKPPPGCHFAPRCLHAMPQCREAYPARTKISATRIVFCYLYENNAGSG